MIASSLLVLAAGVWVTPEATAAPKADVYDLTVTAPATLQGGAGDLVTLAISWTNNGPQAAPGTMVSVTPPVGTSIPTDRLPAGWSLSGRTAVRSYTATLAAGATRRAQLQIQIPASATGGSVLVGGLVSVAGGSGTDSVPGDNRTNFRVSVTAGPSPSATPSPTRTPTPTPTTTTPRPSTTTPSTTTTKARPSTGAPSTATTAAASQTGVAAASTYVIAAAVDPPDSPSPQAQAQALPVIGDDPPSDSRVRLVPLVGAITCFTAAGLLGAVVRRRQAGLRAHESEVRALHRIH